MSVEQRVSVEQFQFDADLGIRVHPRHGKFSYSDGDKIERRMLEILRSTKDLGLFSAELTAKICDWPTQYHFSPARHNLLRHLPLDKKTTVLELGAGCGAITRQLAETAGEVWAVEGSRIRAACAAARTRDLQNVQVFCSDFQLIDTGRQFDVVTLIGVLEYSPMFFNSPQPFLDCLALARSMLKPGGVLLLAIENQLGLKYFCGAPEDHTGKPYDGIQNLYKKRGIRTVGRLELIALLKQAGFHAMQFQYPYPDYKLPTWLFTQRGLRTPEFDPAAILRLQPSQHDGQRISLAADERKARAVLHRNGLLEELSNSFLVVAGDSEDLGGLAGPSLLAAGYTTSRRPQFGTRIEIHQEEAGITVSRKRLTDPVPGQDQLIELVPGTEAYRVGSQLEQRVSTELAAGNIDEAIVQLKRWVSFLMDHAIAEKSATDIFESSVKPDMFDCNPRNLIEVTNPSDGSVTLATIDQEWRYHGPLNLRTAVLLYLKPFCSSEEKLLKKHLKGKAPLPLQLAERLGVSYTGEQFKQANQQRRDINEQIMSRAVSMRGEGRKKNRFARWFGFKR